MKIGHGGCKNCSFVTFFRHSNSESGSSQASSGSDEVDCEELQEDLASVEDKLGAVEGKDLTMKFRYRDFEKSAVCTTLRFRPNWSFYSGLLF